MVCKRCVLAGTGIQAHGRLIRIGRSAALSIKWAMGRAKDSRARALKSVINHPAGNP